MSWQAQKRQNKRRLHSERIQGKKKSVDEFRAQQMNPLSQCLMCKG